MKQLRGIHESSLFEASACLCSALAPQRAPWHRLLAATEMGHLEMVRLLVEAGAQRSKEFGVPGRGSVTAHALARENLGLNVCWSLRYSAAFLT